MVQWCIAIYSEFMIPFSIILNTIIKLDDIGIYLQRLYDYVFKYKNGNSCIIKFDDYIMISR